ncbi:MAG: lytic transglycosylase domain-containing protein, partial [Clostridia bacterium]|nr:lytic transglycosylase domain-containing protein [Clostridia bacterium]
MQKISASILIVLYSVVLSMSAYFCYVNVMYPKKYETQITSVCNKFDISKPLFYALVNTESSFKADAKSHAGAIGLTQILPSTAQYICIKNNLDYSNFDLYNPSDNLELGGMYLRYLLDRFDNIYTAITAYNAGETIVRSWLNDERYSYDQICLYNIPYKETNNYVKKIKNSEKIYK